jgi:DNA-binding CsgD family transcriptional regulator
MGADVRDCRRGPHWSPAPASTMVEEPHAHDVVSGYRSNLAELLPALSVQGEVLAIHAGREALAIGSAAGMTDEATIRTLLTARGLTPRQCDLVVLDVQGHSRTEITEVCGVSPATVKKYWAAIYARLGVESRQMLRAWIGEQLARAPAAPLQKQVGGVENGPWRCDPTPANDLQRTRRKEAPSPNASTVSITSHNVPAC